jgi:lysophospholipase L1-like esterase
MLFQGDSITDAGRNRGSFGPNSGDDLGFGYSRLIADQLLDDHRGEHLQIYNRGISGDRISDLAHRWEKDCLRLLPDLISILIGVNDAWNYLFSGPGTDPEEYRLVFRQILELTRQRLPDVQLVLCEPFILITGTVTGEWVDDISQRQLAVEELAREFDAIFVPYQAALDKAAGQILPHQLLDDGVHPTDRGHRVLADCWMRVVIG